MKGTDNQAFRALNRKMRILQVLVVLSAITLFTSYGRFKKSIEKEGVTIDGTLKKTAFGFDPHDKTSFTSAKSQIENGFSAEKGEQLFNAVCASCHTLGRDQTGPNLEGVLQRWEGNRELLYTWIKSPQKAMESEDPYITALVAKWESRSGIMLAQTVSDQEITDMLGYITMWGKQRSNW